MARTIPQRVLRNEISRVPREVAAGEEVTVTVRGRPVTELRPAQVGPRRFVPVSVAAAERSVRCPPIPSWGRTWLPIRDLLGSLDEL